MNGAHEDYSYKNVLPSQPSPNVASFSGDRFKNVYRLYNSQVPRGRSILIHTANGPKDTIGCLLPGMSVGVNSISNSGDMFKILKARNLNKIMILNP